MVAAENSRYSAKVFNEGSDARLEGIPLAANPHALSPDDYRLWRRGWLDVHWHFGECAKWPIDKLPEVATCR